MITTKKVLEIYGDVPLKFSSYYKYSFRFDGEIDGKYITMYIGTDADDIYRLEVDSDKPMTLRKSDYHYATIIDSNSKQIWVESKP